MKVKINVLVNDYTALPRVRGEHGLSLLVETDDGFKLLFDTGQGDLFYENALIMNKTIEDVDALALSHNHYDHTGGIETFLKINKKAKVYSHPETFRKSYSSHRIHSKNAARDIGFPEEILARLNEPEIATRIVKNPSPQRIGQHFSLTGEIPRKTEFEQVDSSIFRDPNLSVNDTIPDDQALIVFGNEELIIILGCCHSGIINTMEHTKELFPHHRIKAIFGGTHLITASKERVEKTIDYLKNYGNLSIYHGHCTGFIAGCSLNRAFPQNATYFSTGVEYSFDIL